MSVHRAVALLLALAVLAACLLLRQAGPPDYASCRLSNWRLDCEE